MSLVRKFKHGGVQYPLDADTSTELLEKADPALKFAIDLFESVINTYVGDAFLAHAALEGLNFPSAVQATLHHEPTPHLLAEDLQFPILCIYRSEEEWAEHNKAFDRDASVWEWAFILPPLTPLQIRKLTPILRSVGVVVSTFAMGSFDPDFEGGATLRDLSGIQKMRAGKVRYGSFERVSEMDQWWKAVTGQLLVWERDDIVTEAYPEFAGVAAAIDLTPQADTPIVDFVQVTTGLAPVAESIAPSSGTKAGGTPVEILGKNFPTDGQRPLVLIGGAYATNVVVLHPTKLQCLTPEHEAQPAFEGDVQVINPDGQASDVLSAAFTFLTP